MMQLIPTNQDEIQIQLVIPNTSPEKVYQYWTTPTLLESWWVGKVEQLELPGSYHFAWVTQNWHLRGQFFDVQPNKAFSFTWQWDHEMLDQRTVSVTLEAQDDNTILHLHHGTYTEDDQAFRQSHIDGWAFFLEQLLAQITSIR